VGGNITVTIYNGSILGSVYGGGRLASVGTYLVPVSDNNYGLMRDDADHGNITVTIKGGVIGNSHEYVYIAPDATDEQIASAKTNIPYTLFANTNSHNLLHTKGGNVFGGSMGRIKDPSQNGEVYNEHWPRLARSRTTTVNIEGGTIKSCVYGGGEMGSVAHDATVNVTGGTIGTSV
jgi:hypothetical protein